MNRVKFIRAAVASLGLVGTGCWSQSAAPAAISLEKAQTAVVQVSARAIEGAPSARSLGMNRRGSGIVVGPDGLILTIGYLILETEQISVRTRDQKTYPARLVAYDIATGLALLRPLFALPVIEPIKLGSAKVADVGQVLAVMTGEPEQAVEPTRLMDIRAFTGYWEYHLDKALYASPAVDNHSGAALINGEGLLLGVGSLYMQDILREDDPRAAAGNMFVPAELIAQAMKEMQDHGSPAQARRPWLGINAVERNGRILVTRVTPKSPADKAGLEPGALLVSLDGEALNSLAGFYKKLWAKPLNGGTAKLRVLARGQARELEVEMVDRTQTLQTPAGI